MDISSSLGKSEKDLRAFMFSRKRLSEFQMLHILDGIATMSRNYQKNQRALLLIILLIVPIFSILIDTTNATKDTDQLEVISPLLQSQMDESSSGDLIPIILQFQKGTTQEEMNELLDTNEMLGLKIKHVFHLIPIVSLYATKEAAQKLSCVPTIKAIVLDVERQITISEPDDNSYHSLNSLGYVHADEILSADKLWEQGYDGTGITVAVVDSGAQGDHPDLEGQIIGFKDLVNQHDDMDPANGINAYDDNGHGTACAWLVAGTGEGNGNDGTYKGMAPGANLLIIKALNDEGSGSDSDIAEGIEFAVDQGADIISISLGGPWEDSNYIEPSVLASQQAVQDGVIVVIAAGNDGPPASTINSPGITEEVITVGSSSGSAGIVAFSSRGPVHRTITNPKGYFAKPDLVAPGYEVFSGRYESADVDEYPITNSSQYGNLYTQWSGTSASAPLIAGLAALLLDKHAALDPLTTKAALMETATDLNQDAMEQGWGLANVTKASERIEQTSEIITLMTPRKYPALPGSSNVLIVGEEREGQNITVISTVNRGALDIETIGNASKYVTIYSNEIDAVVGYSHFGINLDIPKDLPLSEVGHYQGTLNLKSGNDTIAFINLNFSITTFGGRLLVDMAHHEYDDVDDPSAYKYFREYLLEQGIVLSETSTVSIDLSDLTTSEVFMIMDTETAYSSNEIDALHQFVENGGTLIVLSESYNNQTGVASFGIDSYNEILEPYGIQCEKFEIGRGPDDLTGLFYGIDYGGAVEDHPLMEGVRNLYILSGSTLSVDPSVSGAQGLFWYDAEKTHAIVAIAEMGAGNVIVISDGSTLYDDILYDAITGNADNLRLIKNLAGYVIPETPRIYDIEFNNDASSNLTNVTTYVFDDDLSSVTISVIAPNGTEIPGVIGEFLGYKFVASFSLSTGGFYNIIVVAEDEAGHTKIATKTVLIPASTVQGDLFNAVIVSLLGVVLVGVVFVILKKLGVGKNRERAWEVPVASGTPPEIT
jgi:subtilisin family serine protease